MGKKFAGVDLRISTNRRNVPGKVVITVKMIFAWEGGVQAEKRKRSTNGESEREKKGGINCGNGEEKDLLLLLPGKSSETGKTNRGFVLR